MVDVGQMYGSQPEINFCILPPELSGTSKLPTCLLIHPSTSLRQSKMHAPLGVPERQLACADLITALNECHAQGMLYRWAGMCNTQKHALTMCLRKEVRVFLLRHDLADGLLRE